jgi:hypothetical protein
MDNPPEVEAWWAVEAERVPEFRTGRVQGGTWRPRVLGACLAAAGCGGATSTPAGPAPPLDGGMDGTTLPDGDASPGDGASTELDASRTGDASDAGNPGDALSAADEDAPGDGGAAPGPDAGDGASSTGTPCDEAGSLATTIANTPDFACIASHCSTVITACASDCVCNDAFVSAFLCSGAGGLQTACFTEAVAAHEDDQDVTDFATCIETNENSCAAGSNDP